MAVPIQFQKQKSRAFFDALSNGKALQAPGREWTMDDVLALAGACFCYATGQGPAGADEGADQSEEAEERLWNVFYDEMHAAIEWYADRTMDLVVGEYDAHFEPAHRASVEIEDEMLRVKPISGFKDEQTPPS